MSQQQEHKFILSGQARQVLIDYLLKQPMGEIEGLVYHLRNLPPSTDNLPADPNAPKEELKTNK